MASVQVYDDRDGYSGFGGGDGDNENGEEKAIQAVRPEVFIEGDEIQADAVQHQFNAHQHGNEVPARKESIDPDEEKRRAYK
jgi:hypothetical protein